MQNSLLEINTHPITITGDSLDSLSHNIKEGIEVSLKMAGVMFTAKITHVAGNDLMGNIVVPAGVIHTPGEQIMFDKAHIFDIV